MSDRSLAKLIEFLDYLSKKGLMARNTSAGRKAACSKVLGILAPEELTDVTQVDLNDAMNRFINLEGKSYTPGSLGVYKSRVASAIADFESYLSNPTGYKPSTNSRTLKSDTPRSVVKKREREVPQQQEDQARRPDLTHQLSANVFPIPIRVDVVVRIHGLPFDLTAAEAEKIASVVKAMAMS